jgi:hypothetical protein
MEKISAVVRSLERIDLGIDDPLPVQRGRYSIYGLTPITASGLRYRRGCRCSGLALVPERDTQAECALADRALTAL